MKISVVITAYNVSDFIEFAINSVLTLKYKDIELIVVNDKSTDNTIDKILSIKDSRIRVINNDVNVGAGASRRIGITASTGEYILLLDGDDWIDATFIEDLANEARATGADIVSGGITINHEDGVIDSTSYGNVITEGMDKVTKFWKERIVFMNNKIIRRSLYDKVPYSTRRYIEDTPTIIPLLYFANKVAYIDNTGYHYRMRTTSLTHTASEFQSVLFQLLCTSDLIQFFLLHDKSYIKSIPLCLSYTNLILKLKKLNPTPEMIRKYPEEWIEFTTGLIKQLS